MDTRFQIPSMALLLSFLIFACAAPIPFLIKDYQIGKISETSIGNPILRWATGTRVPRDRPYRVGDVDAIGNRKVVFQSIEEVEKPNGTLKELIYKGTTDDRMQCVYREYNLAEFGAVAKPVFFLDVTYDLKQSKVIGYQDFKIRIESADQQKVVFTVLEEPGSMDETRLRRVVNR